MKRLLIVLAALAVATAQAQVATNSKAKIDPKNNKVSRPVVEKPKEKLMTRDELRACMDQRDANDAEAAAINVELKAYKDNTEKLKAERARLETVATDIKTRSDAAKAEFDAIMKANEEFKAAAPKMEKADFEAKKKELTDRSAAFEVVREKVIADNKKLNEDNATLGTNIDKHNDNFKVLDDRRENQLDKADAWKKDCSNKKYDENDEAAIKKERAAKAAAAAAAAAASASASAPAK